MEVFEKKLKLIKMEITNHTEQNKKNLARCKENFLQHPKNAPRVSMLSFKYVMTESRSLASCPIERVTGFEVQIQKCKRCLCAGTWPNKVSKSLVF